MNKSELKTGNVLKLRSGILYLVCSFGSFDNSNDYVNLDGLDRIDSRIFDDGLTNVIAVYKDHTLTELLWERDEEPIMTNVEIEILKNINPEMKWITRNDNDDLELHIEEPRFDYGEWYSNAYYCQEFNAFKHLFRWIKPCKKYYIPDLLKNIGE